MTVSEKQFIARRIKYQNVVLVNICDEELLGTTVSGGNIDMSISRDYFGGEKVSEEQAIELVRGSSIVNLAGSRIVDCVLDEELANERAVKKVGQVSFLMIYKFSK
ncbi:MAG: DUF424 family protein [Nitrososphaerota archaeon]|nr:DUF424 family protein [Nitrososphaerota archaeon]